MQAADQFSIASPIRIQQAVSDQEVDNDKVTIWLEVFRSEERRVGKD